MHTLKKRELPSNILRYVLLLLGGAVSIMPMIYMISTSLKPNGALYEFPPKFFPALDTITIENYVYIFSQEKFYINFLNSVIVAVLTNVFLIFPAYMTLYGMDWASIVSMCTAVNPWITSVPTMVAFSIIPFNIISFSVTSILAMLLYKKISVPLKKFAQNG